MKILEGDDGDRRKGEETIDFTGTAWAVWIVIVVPCRIKQ